MNNEKAISGTREWADENVNVSKGCSNACKYCYARGMLTKFKVKGKSRESWAREDTYLTQARSVPKRRRAKRLMFPSSHDITPKTLGVCIEALKMILGAEVKHELLIVSKPYPACIERLCEKFGDYKDRILYRFTIGSVDNDTLRFWEPNAPSFEERMESLKLAHSLGFSTSVSCEPMLDDNIEAVVGNVDPFVTDDIWIGKINMLKSRLRVNGENDAGTMRRADELIQTQSDLDILSLYGRLKDNPKIRWKDSIRKVLSDSMGVELTQTA